MANKVLTHQMIAREAAKMLEEEAPFIANINKGRQDEFGADTQGYKKGDSVKIKIPTSGQVFDGAKLKYDVNTVNAKAAGLKISDKLIAVSQ